MDQLLRQGPPDRALAVWAGACLGGTALAGIAVFFLLALAHSPLGTVLAHPLATALTVVAATAYFISLGTLSRLGNAAVQSRRRLWYRSLICNLIVVGTVVTSFGIYGGLEGVKVGLMLCVMELIAIALHVRALALPGLCA
jgi:hypothetical protein